MWHKSGTVDYALALANLPDFSHQPKAPEVQAPESLLGQAVRMTINQ
jgi:hypothetical protein